MDELTRPDSNLREEAEEPEVQRNPKQQALPLPYARSPFFQELQHQVPDSMLQELQHKVPETMFLIMEPCRRRRRVSPPPPPLSAPCAGDVLCCTCLFCCFCQQIGADSGAGGGIPRSCYPACLSLASRFLPDSAGSGCCRARLQLLFCNLGYLRLRLPVASVLVERASSGCIRSDCG